MASVPSIEGLVGERREILNEFLNEREAYLSTELYPTAKPFKRSRIVPLVTIPVMAAGAVRGYINDSRLDLIGTAAAAVVYLDNRRKDSDRDTRWEARRQGSLKKIPRVERERDQAVDRLFELYQHDPDYFVYNGPTVSHVGQVKEKLFDGFIQYRDGMANDQSDARQEFHQHILAGKVLVNGRSYDKWNKGLKTWVDVEFGGIGASNTSECEEE